MKTKLKDVNADEINIVDNSTKIQNQRTQSDIDNEIFALHKRESRINADRSARAIKLFLIAALVFVVILVFGYFVFQYFSSKGISNIFEFLSILNSIDKDSFAINITIFCILFVSSIIPMKLAIDLRFTDSDELRDIKNEIKKLKLERIKKSRN